MTEQQVFVQDDVRVYPRANEKDAVAPAISYEPTARWVRARVGDTYLVDSKNALLQWETGIPTSNYVFPESDVRTEFFRETAVPTDRPRLLASSWFDVEVEGRVIDRLAWRYDTGPLSGYIGLDWFGRKQPGVEHWYEEEEEVWVHPRDPHHRVDALPSSRHVEVHVDGRKLADTTQPVLLYETGLPVRYYVPTKDVDLAQLEETDLLTRCPYKGIASYWSVKDTELGKNIVWSYQDPIPASLAIKGHIAFYNEVVDIHLDGELLERPTTHFVARIVNDAPDTTGV
jgi:uncharacterized protein (DUF427 family)